MSQSQQLQQSPEGDLINEQVAARELGLAVVTLQVWRYKGVGPSYFKLGRAVRYSRLAIGEWLNAQRVGA